MDIAMTTKTDSTILFIDTRESPAIKSYIANAIGVEYTQVIKLNCADFLTWDNCESPHTCGVERKTQNDFMISLADGRIASQVARMDEAYTHPILLIEGGAFEMSQPGQWVTKGKNGTKAVAQTHGRRIMRGNVETGWAHASVQMLLLSLQRQYPKLAIAYTKSRVETADLLRVLHQRARTGCFNGEPGGEPGGEPSGESGESVTCSTTNKQ